MKILEKVESALNAASMRLATVTIEAIVKAGRAPMRMPSIRLIGPREENRGRVGVSAASHDWLRVALGSICYWRSFHHCSSTARTRRSRRSHITALCSLKLLRVPLPAIAAVAHTATVILYTAQSRCAATKPLIRSLPHSFRRFIPSFSRTVS